MNINDKIDKYIDDIYFLKYKVKTPEDKIKLSQYDKKLPLFDIFNENIFMINKEETSEYVINNHYRLPDERILTYIDNIIEEYKQQLKEKLGHEDKKYIKYKIIKLESSLEVMQNYNLEELYKTYINNFSDSCKSNENCDNYTTFIHPSFIKYYWHINPYFTKTELNNYKKEFNIDYNELEDIFIELKKKYIIDKSNIENHFFYMASTHKLSLIQAYTLLESYKVNNYLREIENYKYFNQNIEQLINNLYEIINNSPEINQDIFLFRFIQDDKFLENLEIGDFFQDKAFMSTTRDIFYKSPLYSLGNIRMKIKIPKGIKGVGLFIETISYFYREQECILLPNIKFKLKKINYNVSENIKKEYEFEFVEKGNLDLGNKLKINIEKDSSQFFDLIEKESKLEKKINIFMDFMAERNYPRLNISNFNLNYSYTNVATAYSINAYMSEDDKNKNFTIYYIDNFQLVFTLEILEKNNKNILIINSNDYSTFREKKIHQLVNHYDFLSLVTTLRITFGIDEIVIKSNFITCKCFKTIPKILNYNYDIYDLFKNIDKYKDKNISYFKKLYKYNIFDLYKYTKKDSLYYLLEYYKEQYKVKKIEFGKFYIWIVDTRCYMIDYLFEIIIKSEDPILQKLSSLLIKIKPNVDDSFIKKII